LPAAERLLVEEEAAAPPWLAASKMPVAMCQTRITSDVPCPWHRPQDVAAGDPAQRRRAFAQGTVAASERVDNGGLHLRRHSDMPHHRRVREAKQESLPLMCGYTY